MKKIITIIIIFIILIATILLYKRNNNNKDNLTKVHVAEVAHSIFYAPQYIAISEGFFKENGLKIYVYNSGKKDYPMTFAGLTNRDGSFIVSRKKIDNFTLNDLKGKYIIGGRVGGMPEMTLEYTLKENGIDPKKDLTIDTSIAFSAMSGAFIGGTGDFVTLFEPNALNLEKQGLGHIVAYLGELGGEVPYTAYNAKKSYIKNNPKIIKNFTKAINKALKFVNEEEPSTIANSIIDFFPDTSINDLTKIIKEYKDNNAWKNNININEKEWKHIQDIIISAGIIDSYAPYQDLIYTKYQKLKNNVSKLGVKDSSSRIYDILKEMILNDKKFYYRYSRPIRLW